MPAGRKRLDRKGNMCRQENKRGDRKVESDDSPEIPDRGETSDIPGFPSGVTLVFAVLHLYNILEFFIASVHSFFILFFF